MNYWICQTRPHFVLVIHGISAKGGPLATHLSRTDHSRPREQPPLIKMVLWRNRFRMTRFNSCGSVPIRMVRAQCEQRSTADSHPIVCHSPDWLSIRTLMKSWRVFLSFAGRSTISKPATKYFCGCRDFVSVIGGMISGR